MSEEITPDDRLDAIYGLINDSADEYARNNSGYILDGDELGANNNPQKHNYDRILRHYKAGATPYGERLAAARDLIEKMAKALNKIITGYDNECGRPGVHIEYAGAKEISAKSIADYNAYKQSAEDVEAINDPSQYALKRQETERKIKELTQWKREASELLNPLIEWGQGRSDMPLGGSITEEILRRAKLFTEPGKKERTFEVKRATNGRGTSNLILVINEAIPDIYIGDAPLVPLPAGFKDPIAATVVVDEKGVPVRTSIDTCIVTEYKFT